jgi:hypothetical protein
LMTPEGKRRVLHDVKILNEMKRLSVGGALDVLDKSPRGSMTLYEAKRKAFKQNKAKMDDLAEDFLHPDRNNFRELPDPSLYKDKIFEDEETKQRFKSNGTEFILVE